MQSSRIRGAEHNCLICHSDTAYFFSKTYQADYPGSPFEQPWTVDYWKCKHCGFVVSRTHQDMTAEEWNRLNTTWHHFHEQYSDNLYSSTIIPLPNFAQPPYAEQALALRMLARNGIVDESSVLDYAAGYGTLSKFMSRYLDAPIRIFDRYVTDDSGAVEYVAEGELGKYGVVINSAMFEHVRARETLDEINSLVADNGVLMLHTVVCERVPPDPNWFYIAPMVHTAFHTNESMRILMKQWGYAASLYSPQAKSWFLFKNDHPRLDSLERVASAVNRELQLGYFYYKPDFVDYWKGF